MRYRSTRLDADLEPVRQRCIAAATVDWPPDEQTVKDLARDALKVYEAHPRIVRRRFLPVQVLQRLAEYGH